MEERPAISVTDSGGVTTSHIDDAVKEPKPDDEIVPAPEGDAGDLPARRPSFYAIEGRSRSRSVGERQWTRVRAVMTWYTRLRRIKKSVTVASISIGSVVRRPGFTLIHLRLLTKP